MNDLPVFDPIKQGFFEKKTPASHVGRKAERCDNCGEETPHDHWETILGAHVGFALPFGRQSTKGKAGKKSNWLFCAACGAVTPLDDEAIRELQKAL